VAAVLVLLTGAFLAPLFEDLPQAALGAIVIVAVAGFWRVDELRRFARLRRSALVLSLTALVGVLVLGVLPGLIVAAALSLVLVIRLLSRPSVGTLGRDPATGVWERLDRHPGAEAADGVTVVRSDGPLFYANIVHVREWILATAGAEGSRAVVIDLSTAGDLDVETLDTLAELRRRAREAGRRAAAGLGPRARPRSARAQRPRRPRRDRADGRRRRQRRWSANTVAQSSFTLTTVQPSDRAASSACSAPPVQWNSRSPSSWSTSRRSVRRPPPPANRSVGMSPFELPAAKIGRRPTRLQIRTGLTGPSSKTSGSAR
jgi:MFS superfamily sulfate permease-like transporter